MNAKRLDTTRAARALAEQRLDAEQKRYEVGMSTSFLVIQAQRDLSQAKTNELSAILSYDLSLVDFDSLQQAGPAASGPSGAATPVASALPTGAGATALRTTSTALAPSPLAGVF
jgi:outer membrane protein TolC